MTEQDGEVVVQNVELHRLTTSRVKGRVPWFFETDDIKPLETGKEGSVVLIQERRKVCKTLALKRKELCDLSTKEPT